MISNTMTPNDPRLAIVLKTADETVNNSTTLQNDDELLLAVAANDVWAFILLLRIATTAVADFRLTFTVPAGGVIKLQSDVNGAGTYIGVGNEVDFTAQIAMAFATASANAPANFKVLYIGGAAAGVVQLRWAQGTAEVSDTKVLANSHIIAVKLN